ncbi:MAG: signal peptidase II [Chloroflexi bacterium]|nr:signal peptidase II [Chloroflexota bacterium]
MERLNRLVLGRDTLLFLLLALAVYTADQLTKLWIKTNLLPGQSIPTEGFARLTYTTNTGSAFGILQGQTVFLIMASVLGIIVILAYYRTTGRHVWLLRVALSLVLGGALGNLTDRVLLGSVVDFLDVQLWGGYHWPAFNVADSAIVTGLFLLALFVLVSRRAVPSAPSPPPGT